MNHFQKIDVNSVHENDDYEGSSTMRLSCFLHSLQLCIRDGRTNASYMSKTLGKCRTLAKFSHKSGKMADILEQLNKYISKANITRWNSEYMLVKSILSIRRKDLDVIISSIEHPIKFSNNDFVIFQEIVDVLEPFNEISITCQSETVVTASLVVPAIVHLIVHLCDVKGNVLFCTNLVQQLQLSIETRFAGIVNRLNQLNVEENDPFNDSVYFMAAVLDPSFKFLWLRDLKLSDNAENRLKQSVIQLILDEINKDLTISSTKSFDYSNSFISKPKKWKLFVYDDVNPDQSNGSTIVDPVTELDAYLNDPIRSKFSEYWLHCRMHHLKKLVLRIFSVQASSAHIERVFSHAGLILSQRRAKMGEQLFKELVFLKVNQALFLK
jgi:hAT family C-terminal dimerisation region